MGDFIGTVLFYVILFTFTMTPCAYGQYRDGLDYYYLEFKDGRTMVVQRYKEIKGKQYIMNAYVEKGKINKAVKITAEEARQIEKKKEKVKQSTLTEAHMCQASFNSCVDNTPVLDQDTVNIGWDGIGRCDQYIEITFRGRGKYGHGKTRIQRKLNKAEIDNFWKHASDPVPKKNNYFNPYKKNWEEARDKHKVQCKLTFDNCRKDVGLDPVFWSSPDSELYESIYYPKEKQ